MAAYFVDSNAVGLGDGSSWANAYTTLAAAATARLAGDTFWVGDDHAETQVGAMTIAFAGTISNPNFIYCVDHTKASPGTGDLKTTATISVSGANNINTTGFFYLYGITFQSAGGFRVPNAANNAQAFEASSFSFTSGTGIFGFGGVDCLLTLINTTFQFTNTSQGWQPGSNRGRIVWQKTPSAILGATLPTTFYSPGNGTTALFEGIDLSAFGAGKTLCGNAPSITFFKDCKLGASVTLQAVISNRVQTTYVTRTDSAGTNYFEQNYSYQGTQVDETTIIRTGGATDGTTPKSRKITTTANSKWVLPFESDPITIWNSATGSPLTISLHATSNLAAGAFPNNDDIWLEVEYLGSASSPLGSYATNTKANNLATGSPYTSDGATWAGSPAGGVFSMSVTFTPQLAGPITLTVKAAKASTVFYVDPQPQGLGKIQRSYVVGSPSPALISEASRARAGLHPIDEGISA